MLFCPWDLPGKSAGLGCHFLLQEIFPTQGSNLGLLHCRQMLYHLSHQGRWLEVTTRLAGNCQYLLLMKLPKGSFSRSIYSEIVGWWTYIQGGGWDRNAQPCLQNNLWKIILILIKLKDLATRKLTHFFWDLLQSYQASLRLRFSV